MEKRNPLTLTLDQPFVAGTDDFSPFYNRLHKLNCAIILYCRAGRGTMAIDLKKYEITVNTQVVLLPGAVISLDEKSDDFRVSFFASHIEMFREACIRFEPSFFHFIKEKPLYTSFRIYRPHKRSPACYVYYLCRYRSSFPQPDSAQSPAKFPA